MRVLVTGANGFIGSHVAERLAAQGHDLRLLLRRTSKTEFLDGLSCYERVDGDLRDEASLARAAAGVDAVVHLGGLTLTAALTEAEYVAVNAAGTAAIAKATLAAGARRFVYVSSLQAAGPSPDGRPVPPHESAPISAYGRSKAAGEKAVLALQEEMSVAVVRPPAVYGPRDRAFLPLYRIAKLGVFPLLGDGRNRASLVHVYDAAAAIAGVVAAEGPSGGVYTICDGEPYTWRQIVDAYAAATGRRPRLIPTPPFLYVAAGWLGGLASKLIRRPLPLSPDQIDQMRQRYWVCDNEAIERDLGWRPTLSIAEGMAQTLAWYREHGWL
ncbi:MAG TPA: NAD-dependent epimerase/dehydratase family protein [Dehalococcoidia bacterium]